MILGPENKIRMWGLTKEGDTASLLLLLGMCPLIQEPRRRSCCCRRRCCCSRSSRCCGRWLGRIRPTHQRLLLSGARRILSLGNEPHPSSRSRSTRPMTKPPPCAHSLEGWCRDCRSCRQSWILACGQGLTVSHDSPTRTTPLVCHSLHGVTDMLEVMEGCCEICQLLHDLGLFGLDTLPGPGQARDGVMLEA